MVSQFHNQLLELLYDLNDELKVNLIELNSTKQLFMNGPSQELLKEHLILVIIKDRNKLLKHYKISLHQRKMRKF